MCGIAGIIKKDENKLNKIVPMSDIIEHRGPDGFGYYFGDNIALGHRRLAIIDLTENGKQPMEYMDRYIITYNGEIYNHLELRSELESKGYVFKSHCDTEVIMAGYDYWGTGCLDKFNGMWAFIIYDKVNNSAFCARDRFGVKPFYFMELNGGIAFASEIKQFTVLDEWNPAVNKNRLYDFLIYSIFDHTSETFFHNVFQLRGGECLLFDLNKFDFKIKQWYNLRKKIENNDSDSFESAKQKFLNIFTDAVKLRLRSDVKVGSCLSGGLDSSSIVCVMNRLLQAQGAVNKQETVSSCYNIKEYDEQEYIDEVVKKTRVINHKVFPQYDELIMNLDKIVWHQDEPFASTSIFSQWNVFKCAKENGLTVMLDGQGADEQLAGYDGYFTANFNRLMRCLKFITLKKEINSFKKIFQDRKFNPLIGLCYSLIMSISPGYANNIARKMMSGNNIEWLLEFKGRDKKTIDEIMKKTQSSILNHSFNQLLYTSVPALLRYEDRNSMAHSIESRVPFLDYNLVEYVLSLPDNFKIKDGNTKYVMRQAMKGILPDKVVNRHDKMGFVSPEEVWIRSNSDIFRNELSEACDLLEGIVDRKIVLEWFEDRINSQKSFGYIFWKLICVGRWMDVFNVKVM